MSIDRATGLYGWTKGDLMRLTNRVRRLRQPVAAPPCEECVATDHAHASAQVGPYIICRCLRCPTLTVREVA